MSKVFIEETSLSAIGDAIRAKTGKSDLLSPAQMVTAIGSITGGGSGGDLEPIVLTGNCKYGAASGIGKAAVETFDISTESITNCNNMFYNNKAEAINFDINLASNCTDFGYMFSGAGIKYPPKVVGTFSNQTSNYSNSITLGYLFYGCEKLVEFPYDYFYSWGGLEYLESTKPYTSSRECMFYNCYALRKLPDLAPLVNSANSSSGFYYSAFNNCYALDEIILPVATTAKLNGTTAFYNTFANCSRLKKMVFETKEDGSPKVIESPGYWKTTVLDFSKCGYAGYSYFITKYGIGTDKEVNSDATYATLKNDPDYWTTKADYSRYNHDSAVETLNSLPDVVAMADGAVNTIKFYGSAGSKTDGGAINTLTEEEIAVATARGWTVTFV